jgi:hypothetical protein
MMRNQVHQVIDQVLDLRENLVGRRVPPEARQHFLAARREALLGVRVVVDHALQRLEQEAAEADTHAGGAQKIPVED